MKTSQLASNLVWVGASTLLGIASGLFAFVVVVRLSGTELFVSQMFWISFAGLLGLLVNFGFNLLVPREIGANPDRSPAFELQSLFAIALLPALNETDRVRFSGLAKP